MLNSLYIENIAVIEKITIDFTSGFNVLTGETGAGKSIVIDSINALLGHRLSKDLIRTGASSAFVSGTFSDISQDTRKALTEYGFDTEDDELILQRQLNINGKNTCRVNGRPATLSTLKEISSGLVNIHGQHESYQLMSPDKHITYIDSMGALAADTEEYKATFHKLKECKRALSHAQTDDSQRERKTDLLKYQIEELEAADLQPNEFEKLTEEKNFYSNKEKITEAIEQCVINMEGNEEENGVLSLLKDTMENLNSVTEYNLPNIESINERVTNAYYDLQDCAAEISTLAESSDADGFRLNEIEERLDTIYKLSRKYGSTTEDMLAFLTDCKMQLDNIEQYQSSIEKLEEQFNAVAQIAKKQAKALSDKRKAVSRLFCQRVKEEMVYLDMPNVNIVVQQERCPLCENGCDKIEFLISTNPGEPPKPVSKIASGGELSRMMLAIKNVLSDNDTIDTLIFDEVDTGISGSATQKVGRKLKSLSKLKQVICVTHQAQLAALANSHFFINKVVENGRTFTHVTLLNKKERTEELARIIGGVSITPLTLKHAEEMLEQGEKID